MFFWIKRLSLVALVLYVGALSWLYFFQRDFMYFPKPGYVPPEKTLAASSYQEMKVTTADDLPLIGWYAPATKKTETIVYFHGNADELKSAAPLGLPYINEGYGFLIAEYRGYSNLPGKPSEKGLYADARAFIRSLVMQGVSQKSLILMGHSLGTGVAVQMATEFDVGGVVLLSPYLSIPDMAQARYPIFPARYLVIDRFDNEEKIQKIKAPVLIAHGGEDKVIPLAHGRELFQAANEPKQFYFDPQKQHSDILSDYAFVRASFVWLDMIEKETR